MNENTSLPYTPKPDWIRIKLQSTDSYRQVRTSLKEDKLHTVCEEARCPNMQECWGEHKTATFMILGDTCTRRCRFCAVKTGHPLPPDPLEPQRVADSVQKMGLRHAVLTMVNRDDLSDGGAWLLAETITAIKAKNPQTTVEVLSSDLLGRVEDIKTVILRQPEIMSHNMETVRRLTPGIRSRSNYDRSLFFLQSSVELVQEHGFNTAVKSSLMLGLGEERHEILETIDDLVKVGVTMVNLGQYLQPSRNHAPVQKYWTPDEFDSLKLEILNHGIPFVEAGPLVRSSYHASGQYKAFRELNHPLYKSGTMV